MLNNAIIRSALVVGAVAFTAGFVAPLFLSKSNLGPLLGVFFTGPLGVLAGALWGVVRSAPSADAIETAALCRWLFCLWLLTVADTLFMIVLSPMLGVAAIFLQALVLAGTARFLYNGHITEGLSEIVRRRRPVFLALMSLILLSSVVPPVTHPSYAPATVRSAPTPAFVQIFDGRFDSRRHVPLLVVRGDVLLLEWVVFGAGALGLCRLVTKRRRELS